MAYVFKIIKKNFQIAADGSNYNLIDDFEFISQPFASPEERYTAFILKNNELASSEPIFVCKVQVMYNGVISNGNYTFENNPSQWGVGLTHNGNEQVIERFKEIRDRER